MKKPIVRQLKKVKGSDELVVCVPPEIRETIGSTEGDNLLWEANPDSGIVEVTKVIQLPNQQQNGTHKSSENKSSENKSRADESNKEEQNPQPDVSKFEFCTSCGSDDIQVTGNQFYCGDCDITYEVTPKGTKVVSTNPEKNTDIEHRVEQLENDVDGILDNKSGENEKPGFLQSLFGGGEDDNDGFLQFVPDGAGSDEDEDEGEGEGERGFISW